MMDYWLSFAYYANPNGQAGTMSTNSTNVPDHPFWPAYGEDKNLIQLYAGNTTVKRDDFRADGIRYFTDRPDVFAY